MCIFQGKFLDFTKISKGVKADRQLLKQDIIPSN